MALPSIVQSALTQASQYNSEIQTTGSLLFAKKRTIMGLFADVTIEEQHSDELNITEHPVEIGSPISDHAYMNPPEVTIKLGWSESAGRLNGLLGNSFIAGTPSLIGVYEALQALQRKAIRLVIMTGKRLYTDMLIKSLKVTTDLESENALLVTMTLKKVIITNTLETNLMIEQQKEPEATSPATDTGMVQPKPADISILGQLTGEHAVSGAYTVGQ
ncbi:phage baseplate protein [Acinetobacter bereziniae]|uniref:phage baseplate protein n=1 Tax=Acinetobacter bereziniae TaxID=106648 RepID=UPI001250AAA2|nr:hypothetical protein [Acinetobacter bereziniae]